jgi:hypothetical protein
VTAGPWRNDPACVFLADDSAGARSTPAGPGSEASLDGGDNDGPTAGSWQPHSSAATSSQVWETRTTRRQDWEDANAISRTRPRRRHPGKPHWPCRQPAPAAARRERGEGG